MVCSRCVPYLLGQIGLVGNLLPKYLFQYQIASALPIRSNRISWKLLESLLESYLITVPYLLGQIGLVGNASNCCFWDSNADCPYLLGQIGLVGNPFVR